MDTKTSKPRSSRSLNTTLAIAFFSLTAVALLISSGLQLYTSVQTLQTYLSIRQELLAEAGGKEVSDFIEDEFRALETATDLVDPISISREERELFLDSTLSLQSAYRQLTLLDAQGRQLAEASRFSEISALDITTKLSAEVLAQLQKGERYISPIYIDDATGEPLVVMALPINDIFGDFEGTLAVEVNLKFMWDLVDQFRVGETGYAYVVDNQGNLIAFRDTGRVLRGENVGNIPEVQDFIEGVAAGSHRTQVANYTGLLGTTVAGTYGPLDSPDWAVVIELPWQEAYQDVITQAIWDIVILLSIAFLAGLLGVYIARQMAAPVINLTDVATRIAGGETQLRATASGAQEFTTLATAFNSMTTQLREFITSLEERVLARTKDQATVAEIATTTATIVDTDEMLTRMVHLTQRGFGLYHAHVFTYDADTENLQIVACGYREGDEHEGTHGTTSIPISQEQSLVARAAREREPVIVNDVRNEPGWLPNPLLPETRAELAVPLIVGDELLGVLDVQSERLDAFTKEDANIQMTLASQVAVALKNATSYAESQINEKLLTDALEISRLGNWTYDVDQDIFTFNDPFYAIFRTTAEEAGGYKLPSSVYAQKFVHPEDAAMVGEALQAAMESKERIYTTNLEHRIIFSDGTTGYITVRFTVERDQDGKIIRWSGANQDITERRNLEVEVSTRAKQQATINAISQKIQQTDTIEKAMQIAVRELGRALESPQTLVALDAAALGSDDGTGDFNE